MDTSSIFKKAEKTISTLKKHATVYSCYIESKEDVLLEHAKSILNKGIKINSDAERVFYDSISIIPQYHSAGETRARIDFFLRIARGLGFFSFAGENDVVYISSFAGQLHDVEKNYSQINDLFLASFGTKITLKKLENAEWVESLTQHVAATRDFYMEQHGPWIKRFMDKLGDDLSRESFSTFMRQRIMASIFDNSPICYPVLPPAKTAEWRSARESSVHEFPKLSGCSLYELEHLFYKYIFIYEQYAISGVVEAAPGDTVVDAGAFIGDTASYFSKKIGDRGKVLAFEIAPESIAFAKENMRVNNCTNVEIVPFALSDKSQDVALSFNMIDASSNAVNNKRKDGQSAIIVKAITLDEYCKEHGTVVDFIKADIEGSEMAMLRGAAETISRDAPVCAICLYHKRDDFWEIPQFLEARCPEYTFWFRCEAEPVLFAKKL